MSAVTVSRVCAGKFCGRAASGATAPLAKDRLLHVGDHVVSSLRCIVKTGGAVEGIRPTIVEDIARVILMINKELGTTILCRTSTAMTQRCHVMDKGRIVAELPSHVLADRDVVKGHPQV
jgi:hypothetical protein